MKIFVSLMSLFFIVNCASVSNAVLDKNRFDGDFLKGVYFYNQGEYESALRLFEDINKQVDEPYVVAKMADIYLKQKRYDDAKSLLEGALKKETLKNNSEINFLLGRIYVEKLKLPKDALKFLERAFENSDNAFYGEYLADVLESSGDFASAIKVYTTLLKKGDNSDYYIKRGTLFIKLRLIQKGVEDLLKSDNSSPNIRAKLLLADVFTGENQLEKAEYYLKEILKTHSFLSQVKMRLADIYKLMGEKEKMTEVLEDLKNSFSGEERLFVIKQLANTYLNEQDYDKAIENFELYLKEKPDDTQALFFMGYIYEAKNECDKAIEYYNKTIDLRDDYAEAYKRMAYIFYRRNDYKKAISYLDHIRSADQDADYYRLKTILYSRLDEFKKAEESINDGLQKFPDSEELLFAKVVLKEEQKDYQTVIELMKKLLEIDPENPNYLNYLGYLYSDLNIELEISYKLIKKALEAEPDNSAFLDSMSWVLYRLGRFQESFEYQKKALKISPDEDEMRQHMESILKALGIEKSVDDVIKE